MNHQMTTPIKSIVELLSYENFVKRIENSVGSREYRNLFALVRGVRKDILKDGLISCAYYVSNVCTVLGYLPRPHTTVDGLIVGLENNGWRRVEQPTKPGEILVWEEATQAGGELHKHAGFYMGNDQAISHVDSDRTPSYHHLTFGGTRKVVAVYTRDFE